MSAGRRGQITHRIGGRDYEKVLTFAKMDALEQAVGMGVLDIAENATKMRTAHMVETLCLGIEGAGGQADRRVIGEAVIADGVNSHVGAVAELIARAIMGPGDEGASGNAPAASD